MGCGVLHQHMLEGLRNGSGCVVVVIRQAGATILLEDDHVECLKELWIVVMSRSRWYCSNLALHPQDVAKRMQSV